MESTATAPMRLARLAQDVLPIAFALLLPALPMLVLLADILPRGVAIGGRSYAVALAGIVIVAAAISITGLIIERGWRALARPPLALPLAAMVVTAAIAGVAGVSMKTSAFEIVSELGDLIALVIFWWSMADEGARRRWLALYFASGIVATVFAIALTLTRHPPAAFAYQHGRAAGTFLQPNEFGGYLLFLVPLGLAQLGATPLLRRLGVSAAVVGVVGLALSVSRAAWLGLIVGLFVLVWRFGRRAVFVYVGAAAIALFLGTTTFRDVQHDPSENASRITVWRGAARMAERFALTGVGPIAFSRVYPMLKEPDAAVDEVHAHDLPLNVLVENGILGFAAFVWAVVAGVRAARATGKRIPAGDRERSLLFYGLCAAFIASAIQNVLDVVSTFVFLLWWPMLGIMTSLAPQEKETVVSPTLVGQEAGEPALAGLKSGIPQNAARAATPLLLCLLLGGCSALTATGPRPSPTPTEIPPQLNYYIVAHSSGNRPVEIRDTVHGQTLYLLQATQIGYRTSHSQGRLSNIKLAFFKGRTVRARLSAPTAFVDPSSRNVGLAGGVEAHGQNGAELLADSMAYDGRRHVLTATGHVKAIDEKGNSLSGTRAEADLDLQTIRVFGSNGSSQSMNMSK
jgi:O-Antigen ligase/Lipopolysaccharide-assembly, LptC-related